MIQVFGLKNCDSCRKALKLLKTSHDNVELIDVREQPVTKSLLNDWCAQFGTDKLINRRSTTWRTLNDKQKDVAGCKDAVSLLQSYPSLMKRPVIICGNTTLLGFDADAIRDLKNS